MASKKSTRAGNETGLRHLWLAGLGLIVIARREAMTAASIAIEEAGKLRERAIALANQTESKLLAGVGDAREQFEAGSARVASEVEARITPVLVKLGLRKPKRAARAKRKPATSTTARRSSARKTVKRTLRKTR